jgi:hypothetical protein
MPTLNPISFYSEAGAIAARARRRQGESLASATTQRVNRALCLESNEARALCRRAFDDGYRVENGLPPLTPALRAATVAAEIAQGIKQTANRSAK